MASSSLRFLPFLAAAVLGACLDAEQPPPLEPSADASEQSAIGDPFSAGLRLVADGLVAPVTAMEVPDGSGRLAVVDQAGTIRIIAAGGELLDQPFLDLSDRIVALGVGGPGTFDERGVLGLAFHPEYAANGRFFVYYSAPGGPAGYNHTSRISEFRVTGDPNVADPTSEMILLEVPQPQFNHNAGTLLFGPDGMLYVSLGDGGGGGDRGFGHVSDWYAENAGGNGQDLSENLLGSILRVDVGTPGSYSIPADNPFVGTMARGEIFAYGFRNPYRMSFDLDGPLGLLVSDAGQLLWEEVNQVTSGGNYGWNVKEGSICFNTDDFLTPRPTCPAVDPTTGVPLTDPVIEYANARNPRVPGIGRVVIGGFVYRGDLLPQFNGRYIFGDYSSAGGGADGLIFAATPQGGRQWRMQEIAVRAIDTGSGIERPSDGRVGEFVLGFGQDAAGEVYVLTSDTGVPFGATGKVYQLVKPSGRAPTR